MTKPTDDLDAVRIIATALEGFEAIEQERIIRWAREKLGLSTAIPKADTQTPPAKIETGHGLHGDLPAPLLSKTGTNIKAFLEDKSPTNDMHLAATVAYYYQFEAPEEERKEFITGADLREACRKSDRPRLKDPAQTLRNAHNRGLFDKGKNPGEFILNAVGENLVAMTLPLKRASVSASKKPANKKNATRKNSQPVRKQVKPARKRPKKSS